MEELVDGERREGNLGKACHLVAHGVGIELATHRILHPCVGDEYPPCRNGGSKSGEPCGGEVESARHFLPAEVHHGDEGALHEERHNALDGKGRTEDVAHEPRVVAPVGAEFKLKDYSRRHTHGEVHAEEPLQEDGSVLPELLTCAIIARFHDAHDERKTQRERYEQPVIDGGEGELRPRPVDECWVDSQ